MEIVTKVMEKSWKSHGNLLVKMCTNPVHSFQSFHRDHLLSLPSQATRAQRLSGHHSRTRVVLWRRALLHIPQTVLRKMRRLNCTVEPMPLLGRARSGSPQQGVPRLQEHRVRRVPVSRPHHHELPTDQSLSHIPRTHLCEVH